MRCQYDVLLMPIETVVLIVIFDFFFKECLFDSLFQYEGTTVCVINTCSKMHFNFVNNSQNLLQVNRSVHNF